MLPYSDGRSRQGAPVWRNPQYGFHEKAAVLARTTGAVFLAKTMWFHQNPLRICDDKRITQHPNLPFQRSEAKLNSNVNPVSQQALDRKPG